MFVLPTSRREELQKHLYCTFRSGVKTEKDLEINKFFFLVIFIIKIFVVRFPVIRHINIWS